MRKNKYGEMMLHHVRNILDQFPDPIDPKCFHMNVSSAMFPSFPALEKHGKAMEADKWNNVSATMFPGLSRALACFH